MKRPVPVYRFEKGLSTKHSEEGHVGPDEFETFQNVRVDSGGARRRGGIYRVTRCSTDHTSLDLNGTNEYFDVPYDARVHQLGTAFSIEVCAVCDTITANHYLIGNAAGAVSPGFLCWVDSTGALHWKVITTGGGSVEVVSGAAAIVAGTAFVTKCVRRDTVLDIWLNGVSNLSNGTLVSGEKTVALSTALAFGQHNGASFFDGKIDYIRCHQRSETDQADGWVRHPDPRATYVLWDYTGEIDTTYGTIMRDRSRWENHAKGYNTPGTATGLTIREAGMQAMVPYLDRTGAQRLLVVNGGRIHLAKIVGN